MPWTYMLRCADGSFYVGSTWDLDERMTQHAIGKAGSYTSERRPVTLVWAQECERVDEAFALEHKVKGWRRAKKIALLEGRFPDLPGLSTAGSHEGRAEAYRYAGPSTGSGRGPSTGSGDGPAAA